MECEFVNLWLDVSSDDSFPFLKGFVFDFVIEVTNVTNNGVVLHLGHVAGLDNVFVSSSSNEDINLFQDVFNSNNLVTFHTSLEGADWVDFSDIDSGTGTCHGLATSLSDITVTEN